MPLFQHPLWDKAVWYAWGRLDADPSLAASLPSDVLPAVVFANLYVERDMAGASRLSMQASWDAFVLSGGQTVRLPD